MTTSNKPDLKSINAEYASNVYVAPAHPWTMKGGHDRVGTMEGEVESIQQTLEDHRNDIESIRANLASQRAELEAISRTLDRFRAIEALILARAPIT